MDLSRQNGEFIVCEPELPQFIRKDFEGRVNGMRDDCEGELCVGLTPGIREIKNARQQGLR